MKKYVVFKDIKKSRTRRVLTSTIPYFVLKEFDILDEKVHENFKKLKFINDFKYKISNRKEKDVFRLETLNKDELDLINIEQFFKNRNDVKEGTLDQLVDLYVHELGYTDYEDFVYHINLQQYNKKR